MQELFLSTPYQEMTSGIEVRIVPLFIPQKQENKNFLFSYFVLISNFREDTIRLESRRWIIKDATKKEEIVEGPGVVGQYPVLKPGETFFYSSFCPLKTPTGNMRGTYTFSHEGASDILTARIPLFFLRTDQDLTEHPAVMSWLEKNFQTAH